MDTLLVFSKFHVCKLVHAGSLKCCGTASSVLFCIALRFCFVCSIYSAGVFEVLLHFRNIGKPEVAFVFAVLLN